MSEVLTPEMLRRFFREETERPYRKAQFTIMAHPLDLWRYKLAFDGRCAAIKAAWQFRHHMPSDMVMSVWQSVLRGW